jgi:predicted DNA repair protein MutK
MPIQAAALAMVGVAITILVYGVVGLIVKMDDIGLHLAKRKTRALAALGRAMVKAMPVIMKWLTVIGTAAMLWVGGGIIVHGLEHFHLTPIPLWVEGLSHRAALVPSIGGLAGWITFAVGSAIVGFIVGAVIAGVIHLLPKRRPH